jgi:hypothetical protein
VRPLNRKERHTIEESSMLLKEEGRWLLFFYLTAMAQRVAENASIDLFSATLCVTAVKNKEGRRPPTHISLHSQQQTQHMK